MILIVGICLVVSVGIIRAGDKNWTNPVLLVCCTYYILVIVSRATLSEYEWYGFGILWLMIACIMLIFGFLAAKKIIIKQFKFQRFPSGIRIKRIHDGTWVFIFILIVLGMFRWLYEVYLNGFSIQNFLSLDSLGKMNNSFAVERYSGQSKKNIIMQILNIVIYSVPLCGGFSLAFSKTKKEKLICAFSLLPMFLCLLTNNGKAGFLGIIILFFSAYICGYMCKYGKAPRIKYKYFVILLFCVLLLFCITFFSMMLRIGEISTSTAQIVAKKYLIYAFAEIQSFDLWFSKYSNNSSLTFGQQTYIGIANTLGLAERVQGVYYTLPGTVSNVYTVFRGIVEDFGNILGLVYVWGKGFLLGWCYLKIMYNPRICVIASMIFVGELFFFIYGYMVSPWSYLSYVFAMFVFGFFLCIAKCHNVRVVFGKKVLMK